MRKSPTRSSSPSSTAWCLKPNSALRLAAIVAPVADASSLAPERKSAWRWVSRTRTISAPSDFAASMYRSASRSGSITAAACSGSIKKVVALCASPAAAQPTMGSPLQGLAEVPDRVVHRLSELLVRLQLVHELAEVRVRQFVFQGPSNAGAFAVAFDLESVRPALQEAARLAEAE